MKWMAEYTDTFGGEANYAWVDRETFEVPEDASDLMIVRRGKAAVGLNGVRGRMENDCGYGFTFRPYGSCTILFIFAVED